MKPRQKRKRCSRRKLRTQEALTRVEAETPQDVDAYDMVWFNWEAEYDT